MNKIKFASELIKLAKTLVAEDKNGLDGLNNVKARRFVNDILYKFTKGSYTDEFWKPVNAMFDELNRQNVSFVISDTRYMKNENGIDSAKEWRIAIDFTNDKGRPTVLRGVITASGGGSVQKPLERYDVTAYVS